ncbi:MAG: hypothetical protein AB2551_14020 [Candidatus Thiodiazotropha sp.]
MEENGDALLTVLNFMVLAGVIVIGWLVKSFIPKYLNKKAENFATKEDFNQLLELEKSTTREIESIKGQISKGVWIDQRRWDLKRELYANLLETFHELRKTTANVAATYSPDQDKEFMKRNKDFYDGQKARQRELLDEGGRLTAIAALVIDEKALGTLDSFRKESILLGTEDDPYKYMLSLSNSADRAYRLLLSAARADLLGVVDEESA